MFFVDFRKNNDIRKLVILYYFSHYSKSKAAIAVQHIFKLKNNLNYYMKTETYLKQLLKNEDALFENVRGVNFNLEEAKKFADSATSSVLIKFNRMAKSFQKNYADLNVHPKKFFGFLIGQNRMLKCQKFWVAFDKDVSKIRTCRMLEALIKNSNPQIRRSHLDVMEDAVVDYYFSLNEANRDLLYNNVELKFNNSFKTYLDNSHTGRISEENLKNYYDSSLFWETVLDVLKNLKLKKVV